ncbi:putative DNA binding domain-containing protein [Parabacteroides goldsteinii]|uniref:hypothetical protein n=1 Tax=Parabacteroides goldsteinii TaxID=328812 RepID=UPI001E51C34E|nr:hypothetical protein [Parabacteroides goldsteinii]
MFDEHIRNLEQTIRNYQTSIEDEGLEPRVDVGINVGINEQRTLELIRINNRITAKEVAESLSVSLRQGERIMATLKEKGLIKRVGSNKSGHWEVVE